MAEGRRFLTFDEIVANFSTIEQDQLADSYANDPRVTVSPDRSYYTVAAPHGDYVVAHSGMFGWGLFQGPGLQAVQLSTGGVTDAHLALGGGSAGEIIRTLIGEPR